MNHNNGHLSENHNRWQPLSKIPNLKVFILQVTKSIVSHITFCQIRGCHLVPKIVQINVMNENWAGEWSKKKAQTTETVCNFSIIRIVNSESHFGAQTQTHISAAWKITEKSELE